MAGFDAVTSLRIINCDRLMRAAHHGQFRDLGGALALTSDAPLPAFNRLEGFHTSVRELNMLLDLGFSLLRAFDCEPAVLLTPLDRPEGIEKRLRERSLVPAEHDIAMVWRGDAAGEDPQSGAIDVRRIDPERALKFAEVEHAAFGLAKWALPLLRTSTLANVIDAEQSFYLASVDGEPVGTARTFRDRQATAGIYSIGTLRRYRKRGVAAALVARAIRDSLAAGAVLVTLTTERGSDAVGLYEKLGFVAAHETTLWVTPT